MTNLPFNTYKEAKEFFGISVPTLFYNNLMVIDKFCNSHGYHTLDILFDMFGILRIKGKEARYQQTPIEFFPFGSLGSDGVHYGFIIHTLDEVDFPSGELCAMDSDGVIMIGKNSHDLFQNLLSNNIAIKKFPTLLKELNLDPVPGRNVMYDQNGNGIKLKIKPKKDWKFVDTSDGVGVFAEEIFFDTFNEKISNSSSRLETIEKFEALAEEMRYKNLYASQLFYLKELYWYEWTNYELAKKYLGQMLLPYEKLGRQHLHDIAKEILDTFDERYPAWK